jgi:tetratricopeptide (TPR) repeat protein
MSGKPDTNPATSAPCPEGAQQASPGQRPGERAGQRPGPTGSRKWLYRLAAMTLIPAAVIALLEGSLRVAGYGMDTSFFLDGSRVEQREVWIDNMDFERWVFPADLRGICFPIPFALPRSKAPDTYRVFVLGESAAMGFPDSSTSFARVLEAMLRAHFPDRRFEVVNTAMVAINSHIVRAIARQCARHEPDLLVVHLGNNEVVGPFGAAGVLGPFSPHLQVIRANLAVKTTRSGQLLQRLMGGWGQTKEGPRVWDGMATMAHSHVRADDERLTRINAHFRENLQDICRAATDAGAAVVVCTIGVNLKDSAPFGSLHRSDLDDEETEAWEKAYQAGVRHEERKQYADAVRRYEEASRIDDQYADLAFRLARCYAALGKKGQAKESFVRARDLDTLRFRTDTTINRTIREVIAGQDNERVRLADAERAFERSSPDGIPGEELFLEHVHMNFKGNYLLAHTVFESIPNLAVSAATAPLSEAQCAERLARTEWNEWKHGTQISERLLSGPPFTFQLDHEDRCRRWRENLAAMHARLKSGGVERAVARYQKAIAESPSDWMLRVNFAQLLSESNRAEEAGEQCREALKLLKHLFAAHQTLGNVELKLGHPRTAEEQFRVALRLSPDDVDSHVGLAWALEGQGKRTEALAAVEEQLRKHPKRTVVLMALGRFLYRSGKLAEAKARFAQALEQEPKNAAIHVDLAMTALAQEDIAEAIAHFEEALRIQPDWPALRAHLAEIRKKRDPGKTGPPR